MMDARKVPIGTYGNDPGKEGMGGGKRSGQRTAYVKSL